MTVGDAVIAAKGTHLIVNTTSLLAWGAVAVLAALVIIGFFAAEIEDEIISHPLDRYWF